VEDNSVQKREGQAKEGGTGRPTLELCFISILGLVIVAAFLDALTYDFVSARAPLVILVPLLVLIAVQINRARLAARNTDLSGDLSRVFRGKNGVFNKTAGFMGWMLLLLGLIFVAGHYAGIALFMFILMHLVAEEKLTLSISVSAVVTILIYILFEFVFNITLYRGLIYRIWAGYDIF
jgi:hypothetical protein